MEKRYHNYALITYHSREIIETVLNNTSNIRHWAYILHDKDKKADSDELKEAHYHVLINVANTVTASAIRKYFPAGPSTLAQPVRDKSSCYNYLTHADKLDKYQYPETDIVCDDPDYWHRIQDGDTESNEKTLNILDDMANMVDLYEMVRRYGRDFVVNYDRYRAFAEILRYQRNRENGHVLPERAIVLKDPDQLQIIDPDTGETIVKHR